MANVISVYRAGTPSIVVGGLFGIMLFTRLVASSLPPAATLGNRAATIICANDDQCFLGWMMARTYRSAQPLPAAWSTMYRQGDSATLQWRHDTADAEVAERLAQEGTCLIRQGNDFAGAEKLRLAVQLLDKHGDHNFLYANAINNLGVAEQNLKLYEKAGVCYASAAPVLKALSTRVSERSREAIIKLDLTMLSINQSLNEDAANTAEKAAETRD
jgi:hypothetical protein